MSVPYTFATIPNGNAIPLSYLDANFNYLSTSPAFTGNVTVGGTLTVTGATGLSSLTASGNGSFGGTLGVAGALTLGTPAAAQGILNLSGATSGTVTVKGAAAAGTWSLTLPTTAGTSGYILTTDGTGVSSWTNPTALGIDLDVGSTAITSGTSGRVLYDNAGVLGEYALVPLSVGGTNANLTASNGGIFYSTASAAAILSGTATANQLLTSGASGAPSWTTATYPATTTINQILYSSAANTVTGLPTANGGVINTGATGIPSVTATPTLGVAGASAGRVALSGATSGVVTLQTAAAAGTWSLTLPTTGGTNNYYLKTDGSGVSSWSQISLTAASGSVTGVLPVANGGTNASSAGITAFNNITGYTAAGATGTTSTNLVFSTAPTLTGVSLAAGTNTVAPLTLTSGTNLTTAAAGVVEYDGTSFYATSVASSRQVVDAEQFVCVGATPVSLSNSSTSAQSIFAAANDTLTLAAATTYFFESYLYITTGTTSHTTAIGFGGTATFTSILYDATLVSAAATTIATTVSSVEVITASATVLNAASTNAATKIRLRGVMRINAGGTIIPQVTFSAGPTGTCQTNTNSYFRIWPVGSNTVEAVGNWS